MIESVRDFVLQAWLKPTARDKQKKVGASDLSDPCSLCLWEKLHGVHKEYPSDWPMGAKIGTAIHAELEQLMRFEYGRDVWCEVRVQIGEYEGYGPVKSTSDLYVPKERLLVDYKTTTKKKLKHLSSLINAGLDTTDQKLLAYRAQTHLYGLGMQYTYDETPKDLCILFVPRDASSPHDLVEWRFPYDQEAAEGVFERGRALWSLQEPPAGPDLDCYYCSNYREIKA